MQFHSHADSHVGYQHEIERFLETTDPEYVNLCLDTGHVAYYGGDSLELIARYPDRIGYLHLKQVDPEIVAQVEAEDLDFPEAVTARRHVRAAAGTARDGPGARRRRRPRPRPVRHRRAGHVPLRPERPLPIARRTHTYLAALQRRPIVDRDARTLSLSPDTL